MSDSMKQSGGDTSWADDPRVLAYALGELNAEEREVLDRALAGGDESLRAELRKVEAFLPTLRRSLGEATPAGAEASENGLGEAAREAILARAGTSPARTSSCGRSYGWLRAAAAAVLLWMGIGVWAYLQGPGPADGSNAYVIGDSGGSGRGWRPVISVPHRGEMITGRDGTALEKLKSLGYLGDDGDDLAGPAAHVEAIHDFVLTGDDPLSTFAIDVDTASYARARSRIQTGQLPRADEVRVEEFINYFAYGDAAPAPDAEHPLAVTAQVAAAPWKPEHRLVRIGLAAKRIEFQEREPANLVFLVDVSGSMGSPEKLPLVIDALSMLTESLSPRDRIAIVVYASREGLVLDSTPVAAREAILQALESLDSGGSTNGGAGIQLAYRVARAHRVTGGINRVILCTDGDFNVGASSESALEELIADQARGGIHLTVLGFGRNRFQDGKMESLSNRGDGNYAFIDSPLEARKVLAAEVGGTLVTVAKDTKIQVEWNPEFVHSFRQIGYENRQLAHEDFEDDSVDAGEMGAGHVVSAIYEIVPMPGVDLTTADSIGEVRVRYQPPTGGRSQLLTTPVQDSGATFDEGPEALRFSAAVASFGMLLRSSPHAGDASLPRVRAWALEALGEDPGGLRNAFVALVDRAIQISGR